MTTPGRPEAVLIAGPTASGKSALALALARVHGGTVVNVDSMQVYRDLRILSARPSPAEEAQAPHRLYGEIDGAENFSVGRYLERATSVIEELIARGELPILVGGTGLYFKALLDGISEIPPVPEAVRDRVRAFAEGTPTPDLHAMLSARDPEGAAALRPSDRLRVMRALEVFEATGRGIAAFHDGREGAPLAGRRCAAFFLDVPRETVRARIDARFEAMVAGGALDEVAALRARRLDPYLPVMRAHGVPGLIAHLDGHLGLAAAIARGQGDTRRYAKRQATFFRHQFASRFAFVAPDAVPTAIGQASAS